MQILARPINADKNTFDAWQVNVVIESVLELGKYRENTEQKNANTLSSAVLVMEVLKQAYSKLQDWNAKFRHVLRDQTTHWRLS